MTTVDPLEFYDMDLNYEYTRSYEVRYVANISHKGLNAFRTIKDLDTEILKLKVQQQYEKWNIEYEKKLFKKSIDKSKSEAEKLSKEAQKIQEQLNKILLHTLEIDDAVNWELLKDYSSFEEEKPLMPPKPKNIDKTSFKIHPPKPDYKFYTPKLSYLDKLFPSLNQKKEKIAKERYDAAVDKWNSEVADVDYFNSMLERQHENKLKEYENQINEWQNKLNEWKSSEEKYYAYINARNKEVDELKEKYNTFDKNAILQYCEIVLNNSDYSTFNFPKDFDIDYVENTKTLIVEYKLPTVEDIPTLKEVTYVQSKQDFKEIHLSNTQAQNNYDSIIYQILLRTIHELFEADVINAIEAISLNGWVNALDKSTGRIKNSCIASIHTLKVDFLKIDLSLIEPKLCFKGLKGIGATKLSTLTPISPIQKIDKYDNRFVNPKDVSHKLNESSNLASMDWEDFEHLVRELFHKEFSVNGGEVKVTQSSRDGGVDAIAFDPDPIRGGKIVIQAKRYTNIVGVSAVRDLWGTTMNEGASKGILVTTSNYGSDAYAFVKDKPLALINGNNLLFLLEKHGFNARIDLLEAKKLNKNNF